MKTVDKLYMLLISNEEYLTVDNELVSKLSANQGEPRARFYKRKNEIYTS